MKPFPASIAVIVIEDYCSIKFGYVRFWRARDDPGWWSAAVAVEGNRHSLVRGGRAAAPAHRRCRDRGPGGRAFIRRAPGAGVRPGTGDAVAGRAGGGLAGGGRRPRCRLGALG